MATITDITHSQPDFQLTPVPNFIEQARTCEQLAISLGESSDMTRNQTLCNQLHASLARLQPELLEPIPMRLVEFFTADALPAKQPYFDADCTELCRYCMALSVVLGEQQAGTETEYALRDLLCGLTTFFVEGMLAPRWVNSAEGMDEIKFA